LASVRTRRTRRTRTGSTDPDTRTAAEELRVAAAGHTVLSAVPAQPLVRDTAGADRARDLIGSLTERELEVLESLGAGRSNQ
jgi:DNA-binding NarL/FixJ family response regulator